MSFFRNFRSHARRYLLIEKLELRWLMAADLHSTWEHAFAEVASVDSTIPSANVELHPQSEHYADDGTLRNDARGLAYYVDAAVDANFAVAPEMGPALVSGNGPPVATDQPAYHSNAGYAKKIFLDFNGHRVSGTAWNNQNYTGSYNTGSVIDGPVFSTDSNLTAFSVSELAIIFEVWARVAEDFAPFEVDVTTEEPPASLFTAGGQAIRVLISTDVDATTGQKWFPNAGGVAYLNSFNFQDGSPVWVFANNLSNFGRYIAEASSHEVGHAFDLGHDGRTSPSEQYYQGHGSGATDWAPIMGVAYYASLGQWSRGEYTNANNREDDLAIINRSLIYAADDHGDSSGTATQLTIGSAGDLANSGLISQRTDKDAFRFATQAGPVNLNVAPFDYQTGKGNLDVEISLLNSAGEVLSTVNEVNLIHAGLTTILPKGFYTLIVDGVGRAAIVGDEGYSDYGSIGNYSLSGTVVANAAPVATPDIVSLPMNNSILIDVLANDTDANGDVLSLLSIGTASLGIAVIESGKVRYTPPAGFAGQATFAYTIVDELGATAVGLVTVTAWGNTPPILGVDQTLVSSNEGQTVTNTGTWADGNPGDFVTLSASVGIVSKKENGTWTWSLATSDNVSATSVTITGVDVGGELTTANFSYSVSNLPPVVAVNDSIVSGDVLTTILNSGTYSDVSADTVTLTASSGTLVDNGNGTWSWSVSNSVSSSQTVTITALDEDGGSASTTFVVNVIAAPIDSPYYKGSYYAANGTNIAAAIDVSKKLAKPGIVPLKLSFANVSNYSRGINGLVLDVPGLTATSLTAADFAFSMSPQGAFNQAANPPSIWVSAPMPSNIVVTSSTAIAPARIRIEWPDNAIQNRWLQIRLAANSTAGLPTAQDFYFGHLRGDVNGDVLGGYYFVLNADLAAVRPVGEIGTVNSIRDIDKNGFVLNGDLAIVRGGIIEGLVLTNITIPAISSGSLATGSRLDVSLTAPQIQSAGAGSLVAAQSANADRAIDALLFETAGSSGNTARLRYHLQDQNSAAEYKVTPGKSPAGVAASSKDVSRDSLFASLDFGYWKNLLRRRLG